MQKDEYLHIAKPYDHIVEPAAKKLRTIGMKIFPPQENLAILDVGCGTGSQLVLYQKAGCKLCGIDQSQAMLEVAKRKLGSEADLRLEDATHMSFASGTFDLVTMVLVLHEMPQEMRLAVLRECKRVVKPDGRIFLIDYHIGPYTFPSGWIWKPFVIVMEILAGRRHFLCYRDFMRRKGLEPLVAESHLVVVKRVIKESGVDAFYLLKP